MPRCYPLPLTDTRFNDVEFTSGGKSYERFDYLSLNRVRGSSLRGL